MSEYVKWFKELSKDSIGVAGGKGANLGEMWNAKLPIPPGFMVTAQAYKKFIEDAQIQDKILGLLKDLDIEDTDKLQQTAKEIQNIIVNADMPVDISGRIDREHDAAFIRIYHLLNHNSN